MATGLRATLINPRRLSREILSRFFITVPGDVRGCGGGYSGGVTVSGRLIQLGFKHALHFWQFYLIVIVPALDRNVME